MTKAFILLSLLLVTLRINALVILQPHRHSTVSSAVVTEAAGPVASSSFDLGQETNLVFNLFTVVDDGKAHPYDLRRIRTSARGSLWCALLKIFLFLLHTSWLLCELLHH